jgi:hypothetical protein
MVRLFGEYKLNTLRYLVKLINTMLPINCISFTVKPWSHTTIHLLRHAHNLSLAEEMLLNKLNITSLDNFASSTTGFVQRLVIKAYSGKG